MAEIRIRRHKPYGQARRWRGYFTEDGHQYMWLDGPEKCVVLGMAVLIAKTGTAFTVIDECPRDWPPLEWPLPPTAAPLPDTQPEQETT